jgi:hypothetical protein
VTTTGKTSGEVDRANRMFAVEKAVMLGDLSKKDEILKFISEGTPLEEVPGKKPVLGFHTAP